MQVLQHLTLASLILVHLVLVRHCHHHWLVFHCPLLFHPWLVHHRIQLLDLLPPHLHQSWTMSIMTSLIWKGGYVVLLVWLDNWLLQVHDHLLVCCYTSVITLLVIANLHSNIYHAHFTVCTTHNITHLSLTTYTHRHNYDHYAVCPSIIFIIKYPV